MKSWGGKAKNLEKKAAERGRRKSQKPPP